MPGLFRARATRRSIALPPRGTPMMKPVFRAAALSLALAAAGCAQSPGKAPEQVGKVEFKNSCSPAVQEKLLGGIAMLHSFYYSAAQKTFEEVAARSEERRVGKE